MKAEQTCQIYTLSEDKKEYDKYTYLLTKEAESGGFDRSGLNKIMIDECFESLGLHKSVYLIHDGCDIRKPHSKEMECLDKVRDLEGAIINGYRTFNSVAIEKRELHLLSSTPYSCQEPAYDKEGDYNKKTIEREQLRRISEKLKSVTKEQVIVHLLDRESDDQEVFGFIDEELADKFIIRLKKSRNSDVKGWDEEQNKEVNVKLINKTLANEFIEYYDKFLYKGKCYQQAKAKISYERQYLGGKWYNVVKIDLIDRKGRRIFKDPMLLITNMEVTNELLAKHIYHVYLKRSRIEGVFKFLKQALGWESFQIRELEAIKNVLLLCFFIGSYFYKWEKEFVSNKFIQSVCLLAKSKGKVTRHFFLKGLKRLAEFQLTLAFFKDNNLSKSDIKQILKFTE